MESTGKTAPGPLHGLRVLEFGQIATGPFTGSLPADLGADVVVENLRTGVLKRLGLGYGELRKINPKIVYYSITSYGQVGPCAKKGAFAVTVQGVSGNMSVTGEDGQPLFNCGVPIGDFCVGLYAAG